VELRDEPYDGVIHMVTAAIGAEDAYVNDDVRKETPQQSRELDHKLRDAWTGHPHLLIIQNKDDGLDGKMKRTLAAVLRLVGYPIPVETERKYLVRKVNYDRAHGVKFETVDIWQAYLQGEQRIRKRGQDGRCVYTLTEKKPYGRSNLQRMEVERQLSIREFNTFLEYRDFNLMPIEKRRKCFVWEGQYFELDEFTGNHRGLLLLEVELASPGQVVYLPPWIEIEAEVTEQKEWSNRALAGSLRAGPNGWRNIVDSST
jgi:CYTH domain-containing protein